MNIHEQLRTTLLFHFYSQFFLPSSTLELTNEARAVIGP